MDAELTGRLKVIRVLASHFNWEGHRYPDTVRAFYAKVAWSQEDIYVSRDYGSGNERV